MALPALGLLGARPKTSWVANRMRECSVGITPDSPAAAGEASAADGHARFRSRRGQAQSPNGSHERREAFRTARVRSAALASAAAGPRWRVTLAPHARARLRD